MREVLIIGAGPAGLTAGLELLRKGGGNYSVTLLEKSGRAGGISATVRHNGNCMDLGGHRFFSKVPEVNAWWEKMLPTQGALPYDDVILHRTSTIAYLNPALAPSVSITWQSCVSMANKISP